ncbi:ABC transporter ATP-binding protein [Reyranella sp.]|jgi:lipopolysaccharide transport system ATP-binding protein|uniref:ABC transporter ATP-binding protein n=1 Tax=Reyranella sp. TaxID=1929291 RepID=UPI0027172E9D|nr:ABC transporter ATP-binding protein [Reyranella sp.]MDO8973668.1 ABC transporter ATP-binding protein [Reyranella sp.]
MSDVVIRAEKLGKKFIIGHQVEYSAILGEALVRSARGLLRRGADMLRGRAVVAGDEIEEFWALRDVDFEIKRGEVVSIIGHNGAGKTTMLKILSRILEPTLGRVELNGRVASLLEVGTGFHQELTGRENIFLNGAILGMTRQEVLARFDEIVAFSGVEKFIDTPVKRYSVGMYARLAFSVAAHLETEILFVDEVLAVGDAEFQKRCLDRMSAVASAGRTVLFVSHNLAAVAALTRRGIVLKGGRLIFDGPIENAIAQYSASLSKGKAARDWGRGHHSAIISADLLDAQGRPTDTYEPGTPFNLQVEVETANMPGLGLELHLRDANNLPVAFYSSSIFSQTPLPSEGRHVCRLSLQPLFLASGEYSFDISTNSLTIVVDHGVANAIPFQVAASSPGGIAYDFKQSLGHGVLAMQLASPLRIEPASSEPA